MLERLREMLRKEFIQVLRDPRMKGIIFFMPVFQVIIFGYAITTDVRHLPTAVYDLDNSQESREVIARFTKSGYFDVTENVVTDARAQELIDKSKVKAILRMNAGFGEAIRGGRTADLQLVLDGTDSNTAGVVLSYAARIAEAYSADILVQRLERLYGVVRQIPQVSLETRAWFNENLESRNFYVPGTIATIVTLVTLMLTSMAVVREKEIGTMEQIIVTPIRPIEFILGKTLPFALIAFVDLFVIMVVGVFWFDIPIRGNPLWLLLSVALYLMTTLGVGLIISTISRTQQQAMMSTFLFFFPAMLLSGFMFPIANMPRVIQWLTWLNPLRYLLVIIRGIFLKGIGPEVLWTQMLPLAIMGPAMLLIASSRFRKTLK
jgi:ABC-2 type transport system permease protein